jgi:type II secretory pathway pseudopilin PulG
MLIGKKHIIRHYTIVEVMVAMGIFLVMMTIMMQFFTSAQQVWNAASKRNITYADARVAMNIMTRELQSMLYDNDDDTGIYPFWHEWTDINVDGESRTDIDTYFLANDDLVAQIGGTNSGKSYLTALNFISTTDLKPVDEGSDICEIRYRFIPVYFDATASVSNAKGGKLQRSCTAEYYVSGSTTSANDYNFATYPYVDTSNPAGRVTSVFPSGAPTTAATDFQTVITGVYSMRFTCYKWVDGTGLTIVDPTDSNTKNPANGDPGYTLAMGTPAPVAVRIDMKLMDPKDLKKLAFAIKTSNNKEIRDLKQKMRTFSKVIYLGKREN